jgi:hypothetical protein
MKRRWSRRGVRKVTRRRLEQLLATLPAGKDDAVWQDKVLAAAHAEDESAADVK